MAEIRTTSSTGGEKGVKPQRYSLLPKAGLDAVAEVYGFGASKYAANNWRRGYEWSKSMDALLRHVMAHIDGDTYDEESGLPHLAHAGFHILSGLTWLAEQGEGIDNPFDDRWPAGMARAAMVPRDIPMPATYGEHLQEVIADYAAVVASGESFDTEAWDIQAAAEAVQRYGADAPYPYEGLTPEEHAAREAERRDQRLKQDRRHKLAMEGIAEAALADDEIQHGWLTRDSVLVEEEPDPEPDEAASVVDGPQDGDEVRELEEQPSLSEVLKRLVDRTVVAFQDGAAEAAGFKRNAVAVRRDPAYAEPTVPTFFAELGWISEDGVGVEWKDPEPMTLKALETSLETIALACGVPVEDLMQPPTPPMPEPPFGSGVWLIPDEARFGLFDAADVAPYTAAADEMIQAIIEANERALQAQYAARSGAWVARYLVHEDGTIEKL